MEHTIETNMRVRSHIWEDLAKRIKYKEWAYSISDWLKGPPDVHDFTVDCWGMAMRHAVKPIKVKPSKPKPPASAFHQ